MVKTKSKSDGWFKSYQLMTNSSIDLCIDLLQVGSRNHFSNYKYLLLSNVRLILKYQSSLKKTIPCCAIKYQIVRYCQLVTVMTIRAERNPAFSVLLTLLCLSFYAHTNCVINTYLSWRSMMSVLLKWTLMLLFLVRNLQTCSWKPTSRGRSEPVVPVAYAKNMSKEKHVQGPKETPYSSKLKKIFPV